MRNIYQLMDFMNKHPWKWHISRKSVRWILHFVRYIKTFWTGWQFSMLESVIYKSNNHLNRTTTTLGFDIQKNYSFTISFSLFWHFSTYSGRCRGLLLEMITLTQTHSGGFLWTRDRPVAETWTWQYITLKIDKHPCPPEDTNPQSQQASCCKPIPLAARPLGLALFIHNMIKNYSWGLFKYILLTGMFGWI